MADKTYEERLSSPITTVLFATLAAVFLIGCLWRLRARGVDAVAGICLLLFLMFLFYTLNYRTLVIHLSPEALRLAFGVFKMTVLVANVEACRLDDVPVLLRYGGAGIHFMFVRGRYRVSFNFLEHPRVVVALKQRAGLVSDVSFSTCYPDEVTQLLQGAIPSIQDRLGGARQ